MIFFKVKLKKYFLILVISYIVIRLFAEILLIVKPDLLTFQVSENQTRSFSVDFLIILFEYLMGIIFLFIVRKDLKIFELNCIPLLILTIFSPVSGIIFCLIILFFADYKMKVTSYENNY